MYSRNLQNPSHFTNFIILGIPIPVFIGEICKLPEPRREFCKLPKFSKLVIICNLIYTTFECVVYVSLFCNNNKEHFPYTEPVPCQAVLAAPAGPLPTSAADEIRSGVGRGPREPGPHAEAAQFVTRSVGAVIVRRRWAGACLSARGPSVPTRPRWVSTGDKDDKTDSAMPSNTRPLVEPEGCQGPCPPPPKDPKWPGCPPPKKKRSVGVHFVTALSVFFTADECCHKRQACGRARLGVTRRQFLGVFVVPDFKFIFGIRKSMLNIRD